MVATRCRKRKTCKVDLKVKPVPAKRRKNKSIVGVDRTGGYWGRFSGANAELKYIDRYNQQNLGGTGNIINNLLNISKGSGPSNRIGDYVWVKKVSLNMSIELPGFVNVPFPREDEVRIIVFLDKQSNGLAVYPTDLLQQLSTDGFARCGNEDRFVFLSDKVYGITRKVMTEESDVAFTSSTINKLVTVDLDCDIKITYNQLTSAVNFQHIQNNNIGILVICETSMANWEAKCRIRYSEK